MVATNRPTLTNDVTSRAASAATPSRWIAMAGPSTRGSSGNTQGDSVESMPATKPNPMLANGRVMRVLPRLAVCLLQKRLYGLGVGIPC